MSTVSVTQRLAAAVPRLVSSSAISIQEQGAREPYPLGSFGVTPTALPPGFSSGGFLQAAAAAAGQASQTVSQIPPSWWLEWVQSDSFDVVWFFPGIACTTAEGCTWVAQIRNPYFYQMRYTNTWVPLYNSPYYYPYWLGHTFQAQFEIEATLSTDPAVPGTYVWMHLPVADSSKLIPTQTYRWDLAVVIPTADPDVRKSTKITGKCRVIAGWTQP